MAQPPVFERSTSFANYQAANPSAPLPGASLDAELNNIKETLDALVANIARIQRDDGDLGNETVGIEQLKADLNIGFNQPTAWATGVTYAALEDSVFFAGVFYRCLVDHTSGVFATDLAAEKWEEIADLTSVPLATAAQIGSDATGDLTSTNVQDALAELAADPETEVASGSVTPIGGVKTTRAAITGTTTITAFDTVANRVRFVRFAASLTLTHGASLVLPASANIITEAGDIALFVSDSLGAWRCAAYWRANEAPLSLVEQTVASASTTDIGAARSRRVTITGTTAITSFGTVANRIVFGRFEGALTLTHNGTSLILPGGKDIVTAAGDTFIAASDGSGNWRVYTYMRSNGHSLRVALDTIASASTTELGSKHAEQISISGTTTITAFGSTAPTGAEKVLRFEDALTLTHNATSLILPTGANIITVAGDVARFRHEGSGNWRCLGYQRVNAVANALVAALGADRVLFYDHSALALAALAMGGTSTKIDGTTLKTGAEIASVMAHKNGSAQGIAASTPTKVTFGTEAYDIGSFFASSTWTPPAGKVLITANVELNLGNSGRTVTVSVYKNTVLYRARTERPGFAGLFSFPITFQDEANGTDTYEVYIEHDDSGSRDVSGAAARTNFNGTMI